MAKNNAPTIGVIGGSGLYDLEGFENIERVKLETPYGAPSDAFVTGELFGRKMVFLPRHGVGHRILPHEVNARANIWGMKKLGVEQLLSVSAVGSMKEGIVPGQLVFVDQFIDLTKKRASTFYGEGIALHVPMADPVCKKMRELLFDLSRQEGVVARDHGTYVCIEGPQFSSRAESKVYRHWDIDVIGMSAMPEAKLAREAEIPYALIALATDYDCWHIGQESVNVEGVMRTLEKNVEKSKRIIRAFAKTSSVEHLCKDCMTAARTGLMTPADAIPEKRRKDLEPIMASWSLK